MSVSRANGLVGQSPELPRNDSDFGVLLRRKLYPAQLAAPIAHGYGIQGFSEGTDILLYGEMTTDLPLYNTLDSRG